MTKGGADLVVEAAGHASSLANVFDYARPEGCVSMVGHQHRPENPGRAGQDPDQEPDRARLHRLARRLACGHPLPGADRHRPVADPDPHFPVGRCARRRWSWARSRTRRSRSRWRSPETVGTAETAGGHERIAASLLAWPGGLPSDGIPCVQAWSTVGRRAAMTHSGDISPTRAGPRPFRLPSARVCHGRDLDVALILLCLVSRRPASPMAPCPEPALRSDHRHRRAGPDAGRPAGRVRSSLPGGVSLAVVISTHVPGGNNAELLPGDSARTSSAPSRRGS